MIWWGNMRERDHLGYPGVDGRILLRWLFKKRNVGVRTGSSWHKIIYYIYFQYLNTSYVHVNDYFRFQFAKTKVYPKKEIF
jgi:hypothetical protein